MDFLNEFTKQDLITWIKENCFFSPPKKSDLIFIQWERLTKENINLRDKATNKLKEVDWAKRDEIAIAFNAETNLDKKIKLSEQLMPYEKILKIYLDEETRIQKREAKADKLYKQIDKVMQEE